MYRNKRRYHRNYLLKAVRDDQNLSYELEKVQNTMLKFLNKIVAEKGGKRWLK